MYGAPGIAKRDSCRPSYLHSDALQALHPHEERDSHDSRTVTDARLLRNENGNKPHDEADVTDVTLLSHAEASGTPRPWWLALPSWLSPKPRPPRCSR